MFALTFGKLFQKYHPNSRFCKQMYKSSKQEKSYFEFIVHMLLPLAGLRGIQASLE